MDILSIEDKTYEKDVNKLLLEFCINPTKITGRPVKSLGLWDGISIARTGEVRLWRGAPKLSKGRWVPDYLVTSGVTIGVVHYCTTDGRTTEDLLFNTHMIPCVDSYGYKDGKAVETLASTLRNKLSPIMSLIDFLETKDADEIWEKRFRASALLHAEAIIDLLKEYELKE